MIIFVLLGIGGSQQQRKKPSETLVVDLLASPKESPSRASKSASNSDRVPPKPPPKAPLPPPVARPLDMLILSKEEFAAADISKLSRSAEPNGRSAGDSEAVGRAPNGEILYGAEWYRRPTDVELSGYLPRNAPEGWGLIACRAAPDYRVEDCVELGNHPPGSRLAGAVRQAAWQFRVQPPRKNGRPLIGAWVRIRIDYIQTKRSDDTR